MTEFPGQQVLFCTCPAIRYEQSLYCPGSFMDQTQVPLPMELLYKLGKKSD